MLNSNLLGCLSDMKFVIFSRTIRLMDNNLLK